MDQQEVDVAVGTAVTTRGRAEHASVDGLLAPFSQRLPQSLPELEAEIGE